MEKYIKSIIWKTSGRRKKRCEIWDLWVVVQHIWGTFGLVAFKVILGSFGPLAIFPKIRFPKNVTSTNQSRDFRISPELSSQWSSRNYVNFGFFEILTVEILTFFGRFR